MPTIGSEDKVDRLPFRRWCDASHRRLLTGKGNGSQSLQKTTIVKGRPLSEVLARFGRPTSFFLKFVVCRRPFPCPLLTPFPIFPFLQLFSTSSLPCPPTLSSPTLFSPTFPLPPAKKEVTSYFFRGGGGGPRNRERNRHDTWTSKG
jgi:hypothetical protein